MGDEAKDGLLAWLSFDIDPGYVRNVGAAAFLYKEGGVANPTAVPTGPPATATMDAMSA